MKKSIFTLLPFLLFGCVGNDDGEISPGISNEPQGNYSAQLMTREALDNSISYIADRPILKGGKIYVSGNRVFITEPYKGVHILDNSNPSAPTSLGFIKVPGCLDVAVKGNIMFVDNATDLVEVDISSPSTPIVLSRTKNIFPELASPNGNIPWEYSASARPENTVIIGWKEN